MWDRKKLISQTEEKSRCRKNDKHEFGAVIESGAEGCLQLSQRLHPWTFIREDGGAHAGAALPDERALRRFDAAAFCLI